MFNFTEDDFLPEGTSPGIAGGTPPGKLAITLDAGILKGEVHDLQRGDHVKLMVSIPVDMPGAGRSNVGRPGTNVVATPDVAVLPKQCVFTPLVQDGIVVMPVHKRNVPISSSSLTQGTTTRTVPKEEIVIAVDPQEMHLLTEAMAMKYEITCVARSGRSSPVQSPAARSRNDGASQVGVSQVFTALANAVLGSDRAADSGNAKSDKTGMTTVRQKKTKMPAEDEVAMDSIPGFNPMAQNRFIEVMIGPQRQFVLFTGPGNSPVVAIQDDGSAAKTGSGVVPAGAVEESKQ